MQKVKKSQFPLLAPSFEFQMLYGLLCTVENSYSNGIYCNYENITYDIYKKKKWNIPLADGAKAEH